MATKNQSALAKVQNLYVLQIELWKFLDEKEVDTEKYKSAEKSLKEFKKLLAEVNEDFLGGEDVMETLQWIPEEVGAKLKKAKGKKKHATKKKTKK